MYFLAHYYIAGKRRLNVGADIPAKPAASLALFNFLSAIGHNGAQYDLARKYFDGNGVPRNPSRAYQLFRLSGHPSAKSMLDRLILEMKTSEVDEAERLVKAFKPLPFNTAFSTLIRSQLNVQNAFVSQSQKIVAINDEVFGEGETKEVEIASLPMTLKCLKIERAEITVLVRGEKFVLGMRQ